MNFASKSNACLTQRRSAADSGTVRSVFSGESLPTSNRDTEYPTFRRTVERLEILRRNKLEGTRNSHSSRLSRQLRETNVIVESRRIRRRIPKSADC